MAQIIKKKKFNNPDKALTFPKVKVATVNLVKVSFYSDSGSDN